MRLFGTDGIRGRANEYPMTPEVMLQVGKATAQHLKNRNHAHPRLVLGKDTRISGYMLETALTSGLVSYGANVLLVGPLPTPAVAHLTKSLNCDAGIMISASHNPASDNGIKLFDRRGVKLAEKEEGRIERLAVEGKLNGQADWHAIGKASRVEDARGRYIEFVKASGGNADLEGLKMVLDCAHGAGYSIAPRAFQELGARVVPLNDRPDGYNINRNCGALHPEMLQARVRKEKADFGIALDGDADRCIIVDEKGRVVNGDQLLALFAERLLGQEKLQGRIVVSTVMANSALEAHLTSLGIRMLRTPVGDKFVVERMLKMGASLGGEQSGHLIFGEHLYSADGTLSGMQLAALLAEKGKKLSKLCTLEPWPQVLVNLRVKEKKPLEKMKGVQAAIRNAERELAGTGRVLVRYSGTESLARVMVEGKGKKQVEGLAKEIAGEIRKSLGKGRPAMRKEPERGEGT